MKAVSQSDEPAESHHLNPQLPYSFTVNFSSLFTVLFHYHRSSCVRVFLAPVGICLQ